MSSISVSTLYPDSWSNRHVPATISPKSDECMSCAKTMLLFFFFVLSFGLHFGILSSLSWGQAACFSVIDSPFSEAEGDAPGRVNGQANRPPLHRCTSWSQCLGFVWLGGWWDRGTGLRSPPLWAPSAEFGKKSDTCCLLPEAVCGSLLREEEKCN